MTDNLLNDLFNSPPGPSRHAYSPPPRTPSPHEGSSPRFNQEPLFLSPGETPTRIRPGNEFNDTSYTSNQERKRGGDQRARSSRIATPPRDMMNGSMPAANYGNILDPLAGFDPLGGLNTTNDEEPPKKKRKPIPKIDADRLMSERGIPALIKAAKQFKVRGKNHEAADLKNLLNVYQLWAHQMFPRGDFMSTMGRVENVLRSRRMESSMKGYHEAFYPPPRSPTPLDGFIEHDSISGNENNTNEPSFHRTPSFEPLFDEVDPELEDMMALEEMEREEVALGARNAKDQAVASSKQAVETAGVDTRTAAGVDDGPADLDEEDEWEGLYD